MVNGISMKKFWKCKKEFLELAIKQDYKVIGKYINRLTLI